MPSTNIRVAGKPFFIRIYALNQEDGYKCYFHEKSEWFGRTWGYKTTNKNGAVKQEDEVYDWYRKMVRKNTPQDTDSEEVLNEVVEKLTDEFEQVRQA